MADTDNQPTLNREHRLWRDGYVAVAGVDEAGRGALAGPVTAAAVIVPVGAPLGGIWAAVRDSKLLSPSRRQALAPRIETGALAWAVAHMEASTIDRVGIAPATRQAMATAISRLVPQPDYLLIDWVKLPAINVAQESFAKADRYSVSVAAASILAKVARDLRMTALDESYPYYRFGANKGYGSQAHRDAIIEHGPCAEHRFSFAPIAKPAPLFEVDSA